MSDTPSAVISQRFLERIERSLLRRMTGEIRPHLVRAAAHAHSKEAFLATAARLLVNPREREQWLASWVARVVLPGANGAPDGADTSAAALDSGLGALDTTQPAPLEEIDAPQPRAPFHVDPRQLDQLHEALSRELGATHAAGVLDSEIARSETAGELLGRLQVHLASELQRHRFLAAALSAFQPVR